jgi:hypothetical protein
MGTSEPTIMMFFWKTGQIGISSTEIMKPEVL